MKAVLTFLLLFLISRVALAQTISISGTVKDKQGDALHFAFVQDKQDKYAAYTDSAGNFTLTVKPGAKFRVSCFGYRDTMVSVKNNISFVIVMSEAVNIGGTYKTGNTDRNTDANYAAMRDNMTQIKETNTAAEQPRTISFHGTSKTVTVTPEVFDAAQGAIIPQFNPKEETVGSRYLFKDWVHGYVVNSKDSLIQNPDYWFDYDKMGGGLLLSRDKNSAIEVNKEQVKSFTLVDNTNTSYTFERVPDVDYSHYLQVLASGDKYKIYKSITTKFDKANYSSDGIMATGHNYDEYTNTEVYYIYNVQSSQMQKIELKKKAIKAAFANDAPKLNKFMADHSDDSIDDMYLASLGAYMNDQSGM